MSWEMALRGQALPVGGRGEAHPGPAGLGWGVAGSDDCGSHSGRESSQAGGPSTENGGPGSMSRKVTGAPETVSAPGACWKCPEGWGRGRAPAVLWGLDQTGKFYSSLSSNPSTFFQMVKNLPAMQETQVPSLGPKDPSPGGENSNPPQYSCLENPMGRGALRAAVHGVAKSLT